MNVIDSLRRDHIGAYGNGWIQPPNLDALARESLRFTSAQPEATPTIPARRTIHTGLRAFPLRNWDPHKGDSMKLVCPEVARNNRGGWGCQEAPDQVRKHGCLSSGRQSTPAG